MEKNEEKVMRINTKNNICTRKNEGGGGGLRSNIFLRENRNRTRKYFYYTNIYIWKRHNFFTCSDTLQRTAHNISMIREEVPRIKIRKNKRTCKNINICKKIAGGEILKKNVHIRENINWAGGWGCGRWGKCIVLRCSLG